MVRFKNEASDDPPIVVQKSVNRKYKHSLRLWNFSDKRSMKKRRKSEMIVSGSEDRKHSVMSFCSLDMDALSKIRQYFDACDQNDICAVENLLLRDSFLARQKDGDGCSGLHFAAKHSCKSIMELLHSYGADINSVNDNGDTPLHIAIEFGNEEIVASLISLNASTTIVDNKSFSPLLRAVVLNKPNMIKVLLSYSGKVNITQVDKNNCTALHWAAQLDHAECAAILLKFGCNVNTFCTLKYTALHWGAKCSADRTLDAMLQHENARNCLEVPDREGNTALHLAVDSGHLESVVVCLKYGAKVDARQDHGSTALHLAASQGHLLIVRVLLETYLGESSDDGSKSILLLRDYAGRTPLHRAAMFDYWHVVKYLVEKGPGTLDQLDNENKSPLLSAAVRGASESFKILLNAGSDCGQKDASSRNVLHYLVTYANFDADMTAILAKICNSYGGHLLNQKDILGCTPLHMATKQGSIRFTEAFIHMGATLNCKDLEYQSPLHFAASSLYTLLFYLRNGRLQTVRHLLAVASGQSIINESDSNGKTPVMLACENGHPEVMKLLLQRGAMINRDFTDRSLIHLAAANGHLDALNELLTFHPNLLDQKCRRGVSRGILEGAIGRSSTDPRRGVSHMSMLLLYPLLKIKRTTWPQYHCITAIDFVTFNKPTSVETPPLHLSMQFTALHYAAATNQHEIVDFLLSRKAIYCPENEGKMPLTIAIDRKAKESAIAMIKHERWNEIMSSFVGYENSPMIMLIRFMPDVAQILLYLISVIREANAMEMNSIRRRYRELQNRPNKRLTIFNICQDVWDWILNVVEPAVLDRSITLSKENPTVVEYWQKFDFSYVSDFQSDQHNRNEDHPRVPPASEPCLHTLNTMVKCGRVELLTHPLTINYLSHKWFTYGIWIFLFNIVSYLCFTAFFTYGILLWHQQMRNNNGSNYSIEIKGERPPVHLTIYCRVTLILLFAFSLVCILKELFQMYCNGISYFIDFVNYVEWCLYLSAIVFCMPLFSPKPMAEFNWPMGSLALFLTWFNILFFLQRLDSVGIYIIMFRQVLGTIVKVLCVFSVLFIAFGLSFYLLMWHKGNDNFSTPFSSILQSIMFTMGEFEFSENFIEPYVEGRLIYKHYTHVFLIIFVVLSSLLLVNLLIGLSIDDIKEIRRNATLKRLTMQVEYHTDIEKRLPRSYLHRLNVSSRFLIVYPNRCGKRFIPSIQSIFGRQYQLVERPFEMTIAKNNGQAIGTAENVFENKLLHMQSQMDNMQELLNLICQKLNVAHNSHIGMNSTTNKEKTNAIDNEI